MNMSILARTCFNGVSKLASIDRNFTEKRCNIHMQNKVSSIIAFMWDSPRQRLVAVQEYPCIIFRTYWLLAIIPANEWTSVHVHGSSKYHRNMYTSTPSNSCLFSCISRGVESFCITNLQRNGVLNRCLLQYKGLQINLYKVEKLHEGRRHFI